MNREFPKRSHEDLQFSFAQPPEKFFSTKPRLLPVQDGAIKVTWFSCAPQDGSNDLMFVVRGVDDALLNNLLVSLANHCHLEAPDHQVATLKDMMEILAGLQAQADSRKSNQLINETYQDVRLPTNILPSSTSIFSETDKSFYQEPATRLSIPEKPLPIPAEHWEIQAINQFIEAQINNENFKGADLARSFGCCQMQLYRKLKKLTGLSTSNYIRTYRLHKGKRLLQKGIHNVSEVAFMVGFNSLAYFTRSFKSEFGMCPSALKILIE